MVYYKVTGVGIKVFAEQLDPVPEGYTKATKKEVEKFKQINELKSELAQTDYQAIKYAEGWISEQEYASIKAHRQDLRDQINALEAQLMG